MSALERVFARTIIPNNFLESPVNVEFGNFYTDNQCCIKYDDSPTDSMSASRGVRMLLYVVCSF